MKTLTTLILILSVLFVTAQKTIYRDTLFYNAHWEICEKPIASFYRLGTIVADRYTYYTGAVSDYYMDGTLQMRGFYDGKGNKQGMFRYYYSNGNPEREGFFSDNQMKGDWNYFNKEGKLILQLNCSNDHTFTPLIIINNNGDTLLKNGEGSFDIDLNEFPDIFYATFGIPVKFITGSCRQGLKNGSWKYYRVSGMYNTYRGLETPQRKLIGEEKYKSGVCQSRDGGPFIYIIPQKERTLEKFAPDPIFGSGRAAQASAAAFLFQKISPTTKSVSYSSANNMADYITSICNAINLFRDQGSPVARPLKDFTGEGLLLHSDVIPLDPGKPLPDNINALIKFQLSGIGQPVDIQIEGSIDPALSVAIKYYLSRLYNLSACNHPDSCTIELRLSIEHEKGYFKGHSAYATSTEVKYNTIDSSYKNILVRDSVFIAKLSRAASFPGGEEKWKTYLEGKIWSLRSPPKEYQIERQRYPLVILQFTIDEKGMVEAVTVTNADKADPLLAKKSIEIIQQSPRWIPAEQNGKKIKSTRTQSLRWTFENEEYEL